MSKLTYLYLNFEYNQIVDLDLFGKHFLNYNQLDNI